MPLAPNLVKVSRIQYCKVELLHESYNGILIRTLNVFKVYETESFKSHNECHSWVNIECHVLKCLKYKLKKRKWQILSTILPIMYIHQTLGHSIIKAIRGCILLTLPLKIGNTKTYSKCQLCRHLWKRNTSDYINFVWYQSSS